VKTMTNDSRDFLLINLGLAPNGRGPFALRQDGIPPGSLLQQEDRFFLSRDGEWKLNFAVFLEPDHLNDYLFDTMAEVHERVMSLVGKPVVHDELPEGTKREDVQRAMQQLDNNIARALRERNAVQYSGTK